MGKLSESYWREACAEYVKRMGRYGGLRIEEIAEARLPKNPSPADIGRAVVKEGEDMLSRLPRRAFVCGLFIEGDVYKRQAAASPLKRECPEWRASDKR